MALTLSHYRFGIPELTESTHSWLSGENRSINRLPGATGAFMLRFCVQSTVAGLNNVDLQFQYRLNGGVWNNITTTSNVVRTGSNAVFTDGQNCTKRLSGTGTFTINNNGCTHDGIAGGNNNDIALDGCTECEIGLQIVNADTAVGDFIEFRLVRDGVQLLDVYDVIPSVRVAANILTTQSRIQDIHFSQSAGVNKINNTLVTIEALGLSNTDLQDTTLSLAMNVWGTTVVGSVDPLDYTIHLYGPDVWTGGNTGKDGLIIKPTFSFRQDIPEGVKRVLATFEPNKTVAFGAQATIVE